ncbi:MAG: ribonuclease D [Pseudomonadota bacterium]
MQEITTTDALAQFCDRARGEDYVTIDTEFLRERTYYAQLCLVQMALPGRGEDDAVLVDVLAEGIDLEPLYALLRDSSVVKVFHAARQDVEIFYQMGQVIPDPLFDTQVAAMVCGFGEQVGYETLVRRIAKASLDKSSRFTDWSQRPLSDKQKKYAIADVTFLRDIYESLIDQLEKNGRTSWVREELGVLTSPETYYVEPSEAWRRLKTRTTSGKFLAVARALAAWREREAQTRDVPRNRLIKDDALLEVASNRPTTLEALSKSRLLLREARRGKTAEDILAAVKEGLDCPPEEYPVADAPANRAAPSPALMDLLKVLLKAQSEKAGVAQKLIATSADLEELALSPEADLSVLSGWRREIFGSDALDLIQGDIALSVKNGRVRISRV